jgi:hypothetical protein
VPVDDQYAKSGIAISSACARHAGKIALGGRARIGELAGR